MEVLKSHEIELVSGAGLFSNLANMFQNTIFGAATKLFPTIMNYKPATTLGKALQGAFLGFALVGNPELAKSVPTS